MRPIELAMNATGYSQWVPLDYQESWFGTSLGVTFSEDTSGITAAVQFTLDEPSLKVVQNNPFPVTISRTTTVATVTDSGQYGLGHGLLTNDSVIVKGTGSSNLDSPYASLTASPYGTGDIGVTVASTPTATSWTYTVANSGATVDQGNVQVARLRVFTHALLTALTSRANGSLNYPVRAVRLYVSAYTAGFVTLRILQGIAA